MIASNHSCSLILNINHPLGMGVAKVAFVRQPEVYLGLVQGVCNLVWENTRRQARHDLLGLLEVSSVQDVIIDDEVVAEECSLD